jgi:CheY-like chemotaxis protein
MDKQFTNLTVLYVEDEEEVRENITMALKRRVGTVITAVNGQEGLEMYKAHHPDMIITDLEMPVMNGLVMIEKIREICHPDYPIMVITAYQDEEHYTELADSYLYKPVLFDQMEEMIASLVKQRRKKTEA